MSWFKKIQQGWIIVLLLIVGLGTANRLYNIHIPNNVDEPNIIQRAVKFADGNPHIAWYNWPAQSLIRINGSLFSGVSHTYNLTHRTTQLSTQQLYHFHPEFFKTLSHVVTTVFAILTILTVFGIGYVLRGHTTGLLAAFFLSINYLHTLHSRFATPDVPFVFFILLNVFIALCILKYTPQEKSIQRFLLLLSGAIAGAAIATKYTGAFAIAPIPLAYLLLGLQQLMRSKKIPWDHLNSWCIAIGLFIIGLVTVHTAYNPYFFADIQAIIKQIAFEASPYRLGVDFSGQQVFSKNLVYYPRSSLAWNGTVISLLAYGTMLWALVRIRRTEWALVAMLSILYVTLLFGLSRLGLHWSRWSLPFSGLVVCAAAVGCAEIARMCKKISWSNLRHVLLSILFIIIILPQLTLSFLIGYAASHSLGIAATMSEYVANHVPSSSMVAADMYYLDSDSENHKAYPHLNLFKKTVRQWQDQGIEYIIVKPKRYEYAKAQPERYANIISFFTDLHAHASELVSIKKEEDSLLNHKTDYGFYRNLDLLFKTHTYGASHGTTLRLYKLNN